MLQGQMWEVKQSESLTLVWVTVSWGICPALVSLSKKIQNTYQLQGGCSAGKPDLWPPRAKGSNRKENFFAGGSVAYQRQPGGKVFELSEYKISQTKERGSSLNIFCNLLEWLRSDGGRRMRRDRWNLIDSHLHKDSCLYMISLRLRKLNHPVLSLNLISPKFKHLDRH